MAQLALCALILVTAGPILQAPPATAPADSSPAREPPPEHNSAGILADAVASAAGVVRMNLAQRVELHVTDMPIGEVLRMLSDESRRNIVASKEVSGKVTANLYDVTFEQALDAVLRTNGLGYVRSGEFIFVHTQTELQAIQQAQRKLVTKVFRLRYINAADAKALIAPLLSANGKMSSTPASAAGLTGGINAQATGGNTHSSDDTLILTDDEDVVAQVEQLLAQLDVKPRQVLIEATILRAQLNEQNALGIDFTTVGGVDFMNVGSNSNPAAVNLQTGALPTPELDNTNFAVRGDFNAAVPNGGLTFGIIKNNVGVFLRALEQIADTSVIANPKVLALNKQRGEVIVGRRDGYRTTTVTETAAVQSVEFLETGTQLTFRPFILDDQTVRLEIHPEDSTGGITPAELPFEQTTEVTTNLLLRDGHTVLIGGLFREVTTANRNQIPLLGNIPLAGALFRTTGDSTVREEVIILLTVHVVKGDMEEAEGEALLDDIELRRVGLRRGLLAHGRERIAQAYYRWAVEHLAKGHINRAIWDARLAAHTLPRMMPAIKLVEELCEERMWDDDASTIRQHAQKLILRERGVDAPLFGRDAPPFPIPPEMRGAGGFEDELQDAGRNTEAG